ncbi:MAG: hypothetical protein CMH63_02135 [Nanoarchaeota archaeon]|jgi:hypothetical protein|nr:hypothetical protein [Nanoarchaeota archaeon]|tara:strand:+ start:18223 stop:19428 length:1206 start_codon:yes stop_codon:yes gene_type:complete
MEEKIKTPKFAYLMGYFTADGCFYKDNWKNTCQFEFTDGYGDKKELQHSYQFVKNIKDLFEEQLSKKIPKIRQRGNRYVLYFKDKKLENIFKNKFNFQPGPKSNKINIPKYYKKTNLEKYFWLGLMDGDGIIAQNGRKIALEMCNKNLVVDFQNFLKKNKIITELKEIKPENRKGYISDKSSFLTIIKSPFYDKYTSLIGFIHPRKQNWLIKHLNKGMYSKNRTNIKPLLINKKIIDYTKIFDQRIFIVKGKEILKKYKIGFKSRRNNVKFIELYQDLKNIGISKIEFLKEISNYRFKLSKGSTNSIKMPLYINKKIIHMIKFIRPHSGSLGLSRCHVKSFNKNPQKIIKSIENIFDIKARYTSKDVPLFCSGVLELFFSKILTKDLKEYKLPKWYKDLKC